MVTELKARQLVGRRLRGTVTDNEWGFLEDDGRVADLLTKHGDELTQEVEALADKVRLIRKRFGATPVGSSEPGEAVPLSGRRSADVGERSTAFALALSEAVAAEAGNDHQTEAFRQAHLPGGKLLLLNEVEGWIADRHREQPTEVRVMRVPVPPGWNGHDPLPAEHTAVVVDQLAYVVPGDEYVRKVIAAPSGVLGRLNRLANGLAVSHGWEPAQAATWVLTGVTPRIGLIRVTEGAKNIRDNWWTAWSERITLDVHPAATPEEVTEAYRAARTRLDNKRTLGKYRARSQGIPQLVLVQFVVRRRRQQKPKSWDGLRKEWNAWIAEQNEHVGLKHYAYDSTFRRDAQVGRKRVLFRGYYAGRGAATQAADEEAADERNDYR